MMKNGPSSLNYFVCDECIHEIQIKNDVLWKGEIKVFEVEARMKSYWDNQMIKMDWEKLGYDKEEEFKLNKEDEAKHFSFFLKKYG